MMLRRWCVLVFGVLLCSAATAGGRAAEPVQPLDARELESFLDTVFNEEMAKEHVPGAAVVVVQGNRVVLAKGYGFANVERKIAVEPDKTIFRIGSITKALTALAVVQLADRKQLSLDADVNQYFKPPLVPAKYGKPVLVRDLLTHTAGFDQIGRNRQAENAQSRASLAEFLSAELVRIRPPGQVSCYDTYGITLAGHLVEKVSDKPYATYMRENFFEPLGMTRSAVEVSPALRSSLAIGYGYEEEKYVPMDYEWYVTLPASAIDATVTDMGQLIIALLNDGSNSHGRLFSANAARDIEKTQFTNHPGFAGFTFGFWEDFRNHQRSIQHGGTMLGYRSMLFLVPDADLGFFVACNRDEEAGGGPVPLCDIVTQKLMDRWFPDVSSPAAREPLAIDTERFAGFYAQNLYCHTCYDGEGWDWWTFPVKSTGKGTLEIHKRSWKAVEPTVFEDEKGNRVAFLADATGLVTHIVSDNTACDRLDERLMDEVFGPDWQKRPPEPLLARIYRDSEQWKKAASAYDSIVQRRPDDGRAFYYLGYCQLNAGEPQAARRSLQRALDLELWPPDTSYLMALAFAVEKDNAHAMEWLEKAVELGFWRTQELQTEPRLDPLRDDPRFQRLVK